MTKTFRMTPRPGHPERNATTPMALQTIQLLGFGGFVEGVVFTRDEVKALSKLYGYAPCPQRPLKPSEPPKDPGSNAYYYEKEKYRREFQTWETQNHPNILEKRARDLVAFEEAGAWRNCARYAQHDGLRLVALLAKFCEPGQDPVRVLAELLQGAGFDLSTGWEGDDGDEDGDENGDGDGDDE